MKNILIIKTKIGELTLIEENSFLTNLYFGIKIPTDKYLQKETEILKETKKQLLEYFSKERKTFNIPLKPTGTPFQISVWNKLAQIPYSRTVSYKEIAKRIDNGKAYRAVGGAINKNPIPIIIPCHRVIGSSGELVGYEGGLDKKEFLLKLEHQINLV